MAMPSRRLDDIIAAALASEETAVTPAQRQAAWASVRARAARQTVLPPSRPAPPRRPLAFWMARLLAALGWQAFPEAFPMEANSPHCDRTALRCELLRRATAGVNSSAAFVGYLTYCYSPSTLLRVGLF